MTTGNMIIAGLNGGRGKRTLFVRNYFLRNAIQQIVGRERRERVSQLAWCGGGCFNSRRRVNSTVRRLHGATRNFRGKHHRDAAPYLRTPLLREDHPRQGARARASSATLMPRRVDRAAVWN